ncbi:MAG: nuclear transport factor 2 family protein [Thermoleophilaceae bacterium]|nr:nuclear transport factor 2 family protein [Thermoleophilaceae bacterium]
MATVRAVYEAFTAGDHVTPFEHYHPSIEWKAMDSRWDEGLYHGHAGVKEFWRRWLGSWDEYSIEVTELLGVREHVLAQVVMAALGKNSGVPVSLAHFQVWTFDADGLITHVRFFQERPDALRAVGLAH